jgi:hypothetical protein
LILLRVSRFYSSLPTMTDKPTEPQFHASELLGRSWSAAVAGGTSGASAMAVQVLSLMWLRTTVNYQYRYGKGTSEALKTLWKEGGVRRFYRGLGPALLQGPLSRFGDTFANTGVLFFMKNHEEGKKLPVFVQTAAASVSAGLFRILLMPIDALKTTMQVCFVFGSRATRG